MTPVPRIIESIDNLRKERGEDLIKIFSTIAQRKKSIIINNPSIRGSLIFGISDGRQAGQDFTNWRFQTIAQDINASYFEIWTNHNRGNYFLERSYFHLYTLVKDELRESEYILLHCDASEPDNTPHYLYKQSPHLHIKVAEQPIPKAHFALYNGRTTEVLKNRASFNAALRDSIEIVDSGPC